MICNLRALGLVLAAVFMMSLVGVSSASAQTIGKITSDGPVTQIATTTGSPGSSAITGFGSKLECPKATYTGHKYNATPHELLQSGSTTATINIHYGLCNAFGLPMTVDMNGCDFVFHFTETNGANSYAITEKAVCPEGQHITVTVFSSNANHVNNKPFCHVTITENATGYTGISAIDTGNGFVDMTGTTAGIVGHKKSPTGSVLCPEETDNNMSFHIDLTGSGTNSAGEFTALSMSH